MADAAADAGQVVVADAVLQVLDGAGVGRGEVGDLDPSTMTRNKNSTAREMWQMRQRSHNRDQTGEMAKGHWILWRSWVVEERLGRAIVEAKGILGGRWFGN